MKAREALFFRARGGSNRHVTFLGSDRRALCSRYLLGMITSRRCLVSCLMAFLAGVAVSRADFPAIALKAICLQQLDSPVSIANAADGSGRLFITEQRGKIRIIRNDMLLPEPFLDLSAKLVPERAGFDERGLLGLAFHPGFASGGSAGFRKFYVFYNAPSPNAPGTSQNPVNCQTVVSEFTVPAFGSDVADPASERVLLTFDKPQFNHNGGQLAFGPDGMLYLAVGDGGGSNDNEGGHTGGSAAKPNGILGNAQDKTRLLGKILRIDPLGTNGPGGQYGIPGDNPFVGAGSGVRQEIYAFGLRNPWRFSFDGVRLFCADVGQAKVEEIDLITSGGNYGWRAKEGSFDFDTTAPNGGLPLIDPIAQYEHPGLSPSLGLQPIGISVTGGYVYRGSAFPELTGKYLFGDYGTSFGAPAGTLLGLEEASPNEWTLSKLTVLGGNPIATRILAFGQDEAGEVYVATKVTLAPSSKDPNGVPNGGIYKIVRPVTVTASVAAVRDNTIFSESVDNSNGQGLLFAGRVATGGVRRALLAFDLAGVVPAGAPLSSAAVSLTMDRAMGGASFMSLHRVSADWGEGASDSGLPGGQGVPAQQNDATWIRRFYNAANPGASTSWAAAGGDFASTSSATTLVNTEGVYTWASANLLRDVQGWLAAPPQNFGWILLGNEGTTSAKRFASGEDAVSSRWPSLILGYATQPPLTRREAWLQQYFSVGQFVDDLADLDGDGFLNLLEYAFAFSPLANNSANAGLQISRAEVDVNEVFSVTFRRDPRATDLTYRLETSSDLVNWVEIALSTAGGTPTGSGFVSEAVAAGEAPVLLVTARETLPLGTNRFARLIVVRQP